MARPLVIVFQELAAPTATPTIPDLNTVVVGPAYDLLDYPDDAVSIQLSSTYGTLDQPAGGATPYVPPATGTDAVTVLGGAYPAQAAGSMVDHSSVEFILKFPRVILGSTNPSVTPVIGTGVTTSSTDQTLIELTGMVDYGFVTAGIQAGHRIILTDSTGLVSVSRVVASVGEPNADGLVDTGAVPGSGNGKYLRVTQNLPTPVTGWTYGAGGELRIERELPIQALIDPTNTFVTFPEPGTDKLVLKGGVTLGLLLTPVPTVLIPNPVSTSVSRTLSYSALYLAYRALRADLQDVMSFNSGSLTTVNGIPVVTGVGKVDARNPLAVGLSLALANCGTAPIYGYGVASDDAAGHSNAREAMSTRRDLYCFVPLTQDINIHASYKSEFDGMADPNQALADGVVQRFRMCLGSIPLPVTTTVYDGSISGVPVQQTGALTDKYRTLRITAVSTGSVGVRQVLPGDSITIGIVDPVSGWQNRRGTHKVSHVNTSKAYPLVGDASLLEIIPGSSRWDNSAQAVGGTLDSIEILIKAPDGTVKVSNLAQLTIANGGGSNLYEMLNPTVVGGPYSIEYVAGAALSVVLTGFTILVTFVAATTTNDQVAAAFAAHPILATLLTATPTGSAVVVATGPTSIVPVTGSCVSSIEQNDLLFNWLDDSSAAFLTAGVKAGDVIEIPADPNNYSPTAYDGSILSYVVAAVLNESRLLIANGLDDTDQAANELPHFFARDLPDRYINTVPNAINYRIRRQLSKDDQVLNLTTIAQSVRSKRLAITWPDVVQVSDLRDGSLPRTTSTVRTLAGDVLGYYIGCTVGGAMAGLPAQHGLTNLGLAGINVLRHSQGYFSEKQLTQISDGGFFVMIQKAPGALPICIHQLTTDPTSLETGEVSVVKNVDFVSMFFLELLEPFIGVYNVTASTMNDISRAVADGAENLRSRTIDRIGPPLLSGTVTSIAVSDFDASRIEIYFVGSIPKPLNTIAFHLVV